MELYKKQSSTELKWNADSFNSFGWRHWNRLFCPFWNSRKQCLSLWFWLNPAHFLFAIKIATKFSNWFITLTTKTRVPYWSICFVNTSLAFIRSTSSLLVLRIPRTRQVNTIFLFPFKWKSGNTKSNLLVKELRLEFLLNLGS